MRDGFVIRSIPLFTGSLTFLPACNGDGDIATGTEASTSDGSDTSTDEDATSMTDPTVASVDSTTDDPTTDSGDPVCGDAGSCGAMAPTGWFGPLIYSRVEPGATPPACPAGIDNPGPTVVDGFVDPGPAACACDCSPSAPLDCNGSLVQDGDGYGYEDGGSVFIIDPTGYDDGYYGSDSYGGSGGSYGGSGGGGTGGGFGTTAGYYYGTTGYYGGESEGGYYGESGGGGYCGGGGYESVSETCTNIAINGLVRFNSNDYYGYYGYGGGGTCDETESEVIPPFAWAASIATCRIPETAPLCDDGVCLPAIPEGFESKWCIYQQGDLDCPSGFAEKTIYWSDVDDTRGCSGCQCGALASCEDAELLVYEAEDCAGEPTVVLSANAECTEVVGASMIADFGGDECPVTQDSEAQGEIVPTGPFTFCCDA